MNVEGTKTLIYAWGGVKLLTVHLQSVVGPFYFQAFLPGVGLQDNLRGGPDQIAKFAVFILSPKHPKLVWASFNFYRVRITLLC